jgi:hypothetical protein
MCCTLGRIRSFRGRRRADVVGWAARCLTEEDLERDTREPDESPGDHQGEVLAHHPERYEHDPKRR